MNHFVWSYGSSSIAFQSLQKLLNQFLEKKLNGLSLTGLGRTRTGQEYATALRRCTPRGAPSLTLTAGPGLGAGPRAGQWPRATRADWVKLTGRERVRARANRRLPRHGAESTRTERSVAFSFARHGRAGRWPPRFSGHRRRYAAPPG